MNKYVRNGKIFRAYSQMSCGSTENHEPHAGRWQYTMYGPYFCEGYPAQAEHKPKHRANYTGD